MFGMFCVLNGSGDFIFFLGVVYFSMMVFIYNDFLIIQSTLFYKKKPQKFTRKIILKKRTFLLKYLLSPDIIFMLK